MLSSYKFQIKEVIEKSDLEPNLFEYSTIESKFRITLKGTPLKFEIEQVQDDFNKFITWKTVYKPDFPMSNSPAHAYTMPQVIGDLNNWLGAVVDNYLNEVQLDNKWNEVEYHSIFKNISTLGIDDKSPLNQEDKKLLKRAVTTIKQDIKEEFNPNSEALKQINYKLDYLTQSVDRLNRFDMKGAILNTLLSVGVNLGVDTQTGGRLVDIFKNAFSIIPSLYETAKSFLGL